MNFSNLCNPAYLYFIVSLFYLIITSSTKFDITSILLRLFFMIVWSVVLHLLCSLGHEIIAWIFIIFPIFVEKVINTK